MITAVLTSHPTDLMITIKVFMNRENFLINTFYQFSVCCSYDELKLFRYSAANKIFTTLDCLNAINGLIQWLVGNFFF